MGKQKKRTPDSKVGNALSTGIGLTFTFFTGITGHWDAWWFQWIVVPACLALVCLQLRTLLEATQFFYPVSCTRLSVIAFLILILFEAAFISAFDLLFPRPTPAPFVFVVHSENHPEHRLLLTNEFFQVPYPAKEETFRNKGMVVFPIAPDETNVPLAIAVRCPEFAEHVHFDLIANRKFGIRPGAGWGKLIRTVEMPGQDLDKWRYNFPEAFLPGSGHIAPVLTIPRSSLTNEELEGALLLTAQGKDRPANMVSFNLKFVTVTNRASYTPTAHPDSGWRMKIISHPPTNPSPVTPVP